MKGITLTWNMHSYIQFYVCMIMRKREQLYGKLSNRTTHSMKRKLAGKLHNKIGEPMLWSEQLVGIWWIHQTESKIQTVVCKITSDSEYESEREYIHFSPKSISCVSLNIMFIFIVQSFDEVLTVDISFMFISMYNVHIYI